MRACFAAPVLVAGEGRFDTIAMRALAPALFVKGGAEGVHCASLPELGLGVALKIDDGAKRGAERALAEVLAAFLPGGSHGSRRATRRRDASIGAASASDG